MIDSALRAVIPHLSREGARGRVGATISDLPHPHPPSLRSGDFPLEGEEKT